MKYKTLVSWPIRIYGSSTGFPPIQVKMKHSPINIQNNSFRLGLIAVELNLVEAIGSINKIAIAATSLTTPPNLLGIDRKIA